MRPVRTLVSNSEIPSLSLTYSSRSFNNSQLSFDSPSFGFIRTSAHLPLSRLPRSANFSDPSRSPFSASDCGSHVPSSQSITVPPPYSPFGIVPSKFRYSSGCSSTRTASLLSRVSYEGPFGTAQLRSAPSHSSRKS